MTAAIAEIHRVKCNAGQLNTAHHMPLRTPKGGGSNATLILAGEKKDMKDLYKTLIGDASKVPQDYAKFKSYTTGTLNTQVWLSGPTLTKKKGSADSLNLLIILQ